MLKLKQRIIKGDNEAAILGFPTANMKYTDNYKGYEGVWVIKARIGLEHYSGVSFIGKGKVEIHLFDFDKFIYNQFLRVKYVKKIREVKDFESEQDLISQIEKDVRVAKEYLGII